jgi:hypothetical protein
MPESRPAEVAHRALRQTVTAATKNGCGGGCGGKRFKP